MSLVGRVMSTSECGFTSASHRLISAGLPLRVAFIAWYDDSIDLGELAFSKE